MFKAGDLLLGPYPPGSNKLRRFLILCDEIQEADPRVAWVYLSTSMSDTTVVLVQDCHPSVTDDCCVVYEEAEIIRVSTIRDAIAGNALVQSPTPLADSLLNDVQEGVFASEDTPTRVVKFCTDRT